MEGSRPAISPFGMKYCSRFDPALAERESLTGIDVGFCPAAQAQQIEERYTCDASGSVQAQVFNLTSRYSRTYRLGRWSGKTAPVTPGRKRKIKVEER